MPQVTVPYTPALEGNKLQMTVVATELIATIDNVNIILGTGVSTRRQTEIMAAVDLLRNGLRERNLASFAGNSIFTCVSIDNITANNRRTSSSAATSTFAADDVAVSMGANVTDSGKRSMLFICIDDLAAYLTEQLVDDSLAA